jgi:hypothetical protein
MQKREINCPPPFFTWQAVALIAMMLALASATCWATTETNITSTTWTCPTGVTTATIECWGGGGAGGSATGTGSLRAMGGGGAGGAYVKRTISVTPATVYTVTVGSTATASATATVNGNPSWFGTVGTVFAEGGAGGQTVIATTGSPPLGSGGTGSSASSTGTIIFKGGSGSTSTTTAGSGSGISPGGGGSAGTGSDGNDGANSAGGAAVNGGGAGATGPAASGTSGTPGSAPGGGGSGAWAAASTAARLGGSGAAGKVTITYTIPTPTYTWVATSGSNDWNAAASWSPIRTNPASSDILLFNLGGSSTATNVPTQTIGKFQVSTNTTVALQPTNGANTLTIGEPAADALTVAGGSQLNISGAPGLTNLTVNVATGANGSINGSMTFSDNLASSTSFTLTAADANGIKFNSGATFIQNCGGSVFGNLGATNTIIFASGSRFVSRAGSNPFGLPQPNSKVAFQPGSTYSHQQSANPPSFSGRTYADFELNANATVSGSGAGALSISNLSVVQGTLNLGMNQYSQKGSITVSANATLNFNLTNTFDGSLEQTIGGAGTFIFGNNGVTTITSGSMLTLNLQTNLTLSSGILFTNNGTFNIKSALTGTGAINGSGSITVFSSGTLAPGTGSTFGSLTFATAPTLHGTNFMKVDRNSGSPLADEIVLSSGTLAYGGTLVVTNIGVPLHVNDTFTLFNAPSFSNSFSSIQLPGLPNSYIWNTNQLSVTGQISVSAGSPPKISGIKISGNDIMFNATNGTPSSPVTVLTSTNLALLLAQWAEVTNGNFDGSGNFSCTVTNGFSSNTPLRFYLLQTQ